MDCSAGLVISQQKDVFPWFAQDKEGSVLQFPLPAYVLSLLAEKKGRDVTFLHFHGTSVHIVKPCRHTRNLMIKCYQDKSKSLELFTISMKSYFSQAFKIRLYW